MSEITATTTATTPEQTTEREKAIMDRFLAIYPQLDPRKKERVLGYLIGVIDAVKGVA